MARRCRRASATSARCRRSTGRTGRRRPSISSATIQPQDFAIAAEPGRDTMQAAVIRPFHWHPDFYTIELPVVDGAVQRDESAEHHQIRHRRPLLRRRAACRRCSGAAAARATPDTALACSVAHDKHNIWCVGSSDAAMAKAVNTLRETQGGWALVHKGEVAATVRFEIGGLMTAAPPRSSMPTCRRSTPRAARSTGCTSRPSGRAGTRAFRSG